VCSPCHDRLVRVIQCSAVGWSQSIVAVGPVPLNVLTEADFGMQRGVLLQELLVGVHCTFFASLYSQLQCPLRTRGKRFVLYMCWRLPVLLALSMTRVRPRGRAVERRGLRKRKTSQHKRQGVRFTEADGDEPGIPFTVSQCKRARLASLWVRQYVRRMHLLRRRSQTINTPQHHHHQKHPVSPPEAASNGGERFVVGCVARG